MTLQEAIQARHSVRRYKDVPLAADVVATLQAEIDRLNAESGLHIQLIQNEKKAFRGILAYGTFRGVSNYFVMAGRKSADLDECIGYYGEQLVLKAQTLGLNTCWAGLTYSKIKNTYTLDKDERIGCYIAVGYGETQGAGHKIKSVTDVSNASDATPQWFIDGVKAALLAPTAINQQKFRFEYQGGTKVLASRQFSLAGYTQMDLGIAKLHFELGAGGTGVEWVGNND